MADKRITPYQRLLSDVRDYARKVEFPRTRAMWTYPKAKLADGWQLFDLNERVAAAAQIGYETILESTEAGLVVKYRKRAPDTPFGWGV
jgi:hypothetical protein